MVNKAWIECFWSKSLKFRCFVRNISKHPIEVARNLMTRCFEFKNSAACLRRLKPAKQRKINKLMEQSFILSTSFFVSHMPLIIYCIFRCVFLVPKFMFFFAVYSGSEREGIEIIFSYYSATSDDFYSSRISAFLCCLNNYSNQNKLLERRVDTFSLAACTFERSSGIKNCRLSWQEKNTQEESSKHDKYMKLNFWLFISEHGDGFESNLLPHSFLVFSCFLFVNPLDIFPIFFSVNAKVSARAWYSRVICKNNWKLNTKRL